MAGLIVEEHAGVRIVRDDLVVGGTKARVTPALMAQGASEWVFAGPAQGYAQVALALGSLQSGVPASFFCAKRKEPLPLTRAAVALGLRVIEVPAGRISVVQARAREYCELTGATFLPLGLRLPGIDAALRQLAATIPAPDQAWVAVGSGTIAAALADAWPACDVHGVVVGMAPQIRHERVTYHRAPEAFDEPAAGPLPPVPSVATYDAKTWRFIEEQAAAGALWWNVGGPAPSPEAARALAAELRDA